MINNEIYYSLKVLQEADEKYLKDIIEREYDNMCYNISYQGWYRKDIPMVQYLFENENTYLNPKELESTIDKIMENIMNR